MSTGEENLLLDEVTGEKVSKKYVKIKSIFFDDPYNFIELNFNLLLL